MQKRDIHPINACELKFISLIFLRSYIAGPEPILMIQFLMIWEDFGRAWTPNTVVILIQFDLRDMHKGEINFREIGQRVFIARRISDTFFTN